VSAEQDIPPDPNPSAPTGDEVTARTSNPDLGAEAGTASSLRNKKREEQLTMVPVEIGGRDGPDPTRFGDWELKGRCIDF
jgi:hypothetical protein